MGRECKSCERSPAEVITCAVCHCLLNSYCANCDLEDRMECLSSTGRYSEKFHCRAGDVPGLKEMLLVALGKDA